MRGEDEGKKQGDGKGAEIVESEYARNEFFEVGLLLVEYAHDERDFHADNEADDEHQGVEQAAKGHGGITEGNKEKERAKAAGDADEEFDVDKACEGLFVCDVAREVCADAHGKEIQADDGGELQDAVAEQIRGQRSNDEFVGKPAASDDKDGDDEDVVGFHRGKQQGEMGLYLPLLSSGEQGDGL